VHDFGLNYRLPDILCALGISQLGRLSEFKHNRSQIFETYGEAFKDVSSIVPPIKRSYVDPMWHLYSIKVESSRRREVFQKMRKQNVGLQVNYMPAYWHPVFDRKKYPKGLCPVSEQMYSQQLSLPIHNNLSQDDLDHVINSLIQILGK
jgi:perosamine synthetase